MTVRQPTAHRRPRARPGALVALVALVPLLAGTAAADPPDWEPAVWNDRPVRLDLSGPEELARLLRTVPVASFHREQLRPLPDGRLRWEPRVTEDEAAALLRAGWAPAPLPDRSRAGREEAEAQWARRAATKARLAPGELTTYPSHGDIDYLCELMATQHPDICRRVTWGTSLEGRELWGLVISDDVQHTEPEPEVRLSATIHGDEPVGTVLLMNLADLLTSAYGQPGREDLTALVDALEIHILPLHNPDGYAIGTRRNRNNVDLNRNFLEPAGTADELEPENEVFAAYSLQRHFMLSGNAHTGALVVNYPWDWTFDLTPDDAAIAALSTEYASRNPPMAASTTFPGGIVRGAVWFVATGTLQDWSYDRTGCIDLTLEQNDVKWPQSLFLPGLWDDNRDSYLALLTAATWGLHGVVSDADTGAPLDATVVVAGNGMPVFTDPEHGDYHKLLPTGTWDLTISAEGYETATVAGVTTTWGAGTTVDVALTPTTSEVPGVPSASLEAAPNPFNGGTSLSFVNPHAGRIELAIYDLRGRRVAGLLAGHRPAGPDSVRWDGTDGAGRRLASGVYLARLRAGGGQERVVKVGLIR